ncbi:MAG: T9SS type A sorting domain-containing protein [Crocinitomicaceae bacterium]|nr:T9SS type A sorting domain-containing protein [Crocinitomicaceae bacterium]
MKKIYTLLFLAFFAGFATAQSFVIHDENGDLVTSPVITIDSASTVEYATAHYYIVNTTGGALNCTWSRIRRAHDASIATDQICDEILCFDADDATTYNRPLTFSIPAGDSSVFQPKVWPGDVAACVIYTYNIYSGLGNFEDSIQIKFRFDAQDCFLNTEQIQEINYNAYPNPASDVFTVEMATNGNDVKLILYNVLGERVKFQNMVDGKNNISLSGLNNGVYFYSILRNAEVIETKKLVVRN